MKILGITGGIGSGKSIVSRLLEIMEIPVYDCDREAKRIMGSSVTVRKKLCDEFGDDIYRENTLNKVMLAAIIFNNPEHLKFVNSLIHPEVYNDFLVWGKKRSFRKWIGIESAILFESRFDRMVDITIHVTAPEEIRIQRIQKRDHTERESILNRMHNQMSDKEKNCLANYIIVNDNKRGLLPQIENLLEVLKYREIA
jgi:dephospho-CoA kinase